MPPMGRRIRIMGSPGSGKTTIARAIAQTTGLPLLSLDELRRPLKAVQPRERRTELLRGGLEEFVADHDEWIIEGNQLDWARETIELASYGVVLSRPLRVRAFRCFRRWQLSRERQGGTLDRLLGLELYTARWDSRWLPPLLDLCRAAGLPWIYCRTEKDVTTLLGSFPGALESYLAEIEGGRPAPESASTEHESGEAEPEEQALVASTGGCFMSAPSHGEDTVREPCGVGQGDTRDKEASFSFYRARESSSESPA